MEFLTAPVFYNTDGSMAKPGDYAEAVRWMLVSSTYLPSCYASLFSCSYGEPF